VDDRNISIARSSIYLVKADSIAFAAPGLSTRAAFAGDRVSRAPAATAARRDAREDDLRILEASARYRARLANFIRRRVPDRGEADDILQEVFYELVAAYRLFEPVEEAGAWMFRVARNRITDFFRKKKPEPLPEAVGGSSARSQDAVPMQIEELLPSADAGPEAAYARGVLLDEIEAAVDELPPEQRAAFVGHEIEGRSFKELAAEAGVSVNAMVLRKHHAVLYLRRRLQAIHDEFLGE
jgi:RNA polymerase sigma factor (sigma-70 family)